MKKVVAIIPARYASSRFPGKLIKKLSGEPVIKHVYENIKKTGLFSEIIIATDDKRIAEVADKFGGKCVMTSAHHKSGTDRVAEVAEKTDADIILNVQGDEPFITGKPLEKLISEFDDPQVEIASLMHKITEENEIKNSNNVKLVVDKNSDALYFSRSMIPFNRDNKKEVTYLKHTGVYAYRKETLLRLVKLPVSDLEDTEKLEQLRFLENGFKIRMVLTEYSGIGIDTPEDLEKAEITARSLNA
ncbi:MAG: 3-deoxy-manno-octulosonate cytidylyltransferase [Candidatus Cloacimonadota bacterium]|nr:MAG: 3-deoxy-manno-octulosonate cytidylyltransferase [Candidatus Cloacimonadota bacterium]